MELDKKKHGAKTHHTTQKKRHAIQLVWALLTNSYLTGFLYGKIYTGKLKQLCVPGLNCYSCPGALGSCPIGALQAVLGSRNFKFSFYLAGFFLLIGALMGRFVCGFLCPFGLIQELLHKIPFFKKIRYVPGEKVLVKLKYLILLIFVILLPLYAVDILGQGSPWFCKLICPAGTLEGGLPLVFLNEALQNTIGFLYAWKNAILILTILASILIYRPFCKFICPLGAIYSFFNRVAIFRHRVDPKRCTECRLCAHICPMNVNPAKNPNSAECIRCGACIKACPAQALSHTFTKRTEISSHTTSSAPLPPSSNGY